MNCKANQTTPQRNLSRNYNEQVSSLKTVTVLKILSIVRFLKIQFLVSSIMHILQKNAYILKENLFYLFSDNSNLILYVK